MNLFGWNSLFLFLLVHLQSCSLSSVVLRSFGSCTSSSFSRSIGYILRGFLLGKMEVGDTMECKKRCIISSNCRSVNILAVAGGRFVCHLNNAHMEDGISGQFVPQGAGEYYGLKERKLCKSDGTTCDNVSPWFAFNQSYFQYVRSAKTHADAKKYCQERSGILASISSEEEQTFVFETFIAPDSGATEYTRIGMNDIKTEGVYVWEDGSPVGHLRFANGEPNNLRNEDCMTIWKGDGGYNDLPCDTMPSFFICETNYNSLYP